METVTLIQQFLNNWLISVCIKPQLTLIAYSLGAVRYTSDFIDRNNLLIKYFQKFNNIYPIQAKVASTPSENVRKP